MRLALYHLQKFGNSEPDIGRRVLVQTQLVQEFNFFILLLIIANKIEDMDECLVKKGAKAIWIQFFLMDGMLDLFLFQEPATDIYGSFWKK